MNKLERAKQFMAFDALKGLQEALREKEQELEDRKILSEESSLELEVQLHRLRKGSRVEIEYYKNHQYVSISGIIADIDKINKAIILNDDEYIDFYDVIKVAIL